MPKGKSLKVVFKQDNQHQGMLIPLNLNDMVLPNDPVRVVSAVLDKVDISEIIKQFRPGGTSSYHPRMLLKVIVYAYINNIYSSRKIEEALRQNVNFMWLAGLSKPDHNTINRFRGERLQKTLKPIFHEVVIMLFEEGLLNIRDLYTDGTIIEANANRYRFVWGKTIKNNREKISKQLEELWTYARSVAAAELDDTDPSGFKKITAETLNQAVDNINAALKGKPVDKDVRKKLNHAKKHWPAALDRYDQQERIMGAKRNSYSKTDNDATFMHLKEDHQRKGQVKPAYNLQISTNSQFITTYSLHQNTNDTGTLPGHLTEYIQQYGIKPTCVTADAGYGSEQNYQWLEDEGITGYVKHNQFDSNERKGANNKNPCGPESLIYDESKDQYICPSGELMSNVGSFKKFTQRGFEQTLTTYKTDKCSGCPLQSKCNPGNALRTIDVNHNLNRLRKKADKLLRSKQGIEKRKRRSIDTEPVFGNIKNNHHFRRFMLRGIQKVTVETGLLALAHNLRKKIA
jgi:transposase